MNYGPTHPPTLAELAARIEQQGREIADLRAAIDRTDQRIVGHDLELSELPYTDRRTETLRVLLAEPSHNGNGDGDGHD
jgi:hypothetical protein